MYISLDNTCDTKGGSEFDIQTLGPSPGLQGQALQGQGWRICTQNNLINSLGNSGLQTGTLQSPFLGTVNTACILSLENFTLTCIGA